MILSRALTDVGYWSGWEQRDQEITLKFRGAQLWTPDADEPLPEVQLVFGNPDIAYFLDFASDLPERWFDETFADAQSSWGKVIMPGPYYVRENSFGFGSPEFCDDLLAQARKVGVLTRLETQGEWLLAFGAARGRVGVIVQAQTLELRDCQGPFPLAEVESRRQRWWAHHQAYWQSKNSANPQPWNFACETTIPMAGLAANAG